jgi:hypothetical protein
VKRTRRCSNRIRCRRISQGGSIERVEEELQGAQGLRAVLGTEADQDDAALADAEVDDGGAALEALATFDVAREQDAARVVGVGGDEAAGRPGDESYRLYVGFGNVF